MGGREERRKFFMHSYLYNFRHGTFTHSFTWMLSHVHTDTHLPRQKALIITADMYYPSMNDIYRKIEGMF